MRPRSRCVSGGPVREASRLSARLSRDCVPMRAPPTHIGSLAAEFRTARSIPGSRTSAPGRLLSAGAGCRRQPAPALHDGGEQSGREAAARPRDRGAADQGPGHGVHDDSPSADPRREVSAAMGESAAPLRPPPPARADVPHGGAPRSDDRLSASLAQGGRQPPLSTSHRHAEPPMARPPKQRHCHRFDRGNSHTGPGGQRPFCRTAQNITARTDQDTKRTGSVGPGGQPPAGIRR